MKSKPLLFISIITVIFAMTWSYCTYFKVEKMEAPLSLKESDLNKLTLTPERIKNIHIQTIIAESSHFSQKIELIGETEAVPDSIIDVPARVSGRITSVNFIEGDKIKKGQTLVTIDSPELARLRSNYMTAKTKYFASEQNFERIKSLVQMNLAAIQELVDAESNLKVIRSERIAAEENLRVNGLSISDSVSGVYHVSAPSSGLAILRNAVPGSQVLGNQTLTTIANLSTLWFQGKIFEGDLRLLEEGDAAKVILNAYPNMVFNGTLEHIGEKVDPISRTIHARIVFKNSEKKGKIGLFGKAFIDISPKEGIKIPSTAVQSFQEKKYVFLKLSELDFVWTEVEVGSVIENFTEIRSGLNLGDEVVIQGAFELKALFFKSSFGEE